jgi:hypothetical protein
VDKIPNLQTVFGGSNLSLLNPQGKMGLIVQSRWFKTTYAKKIRQYITSNSLLSQVIDFKANNIFKNRITYIASLILSKEPKSKIIFKKISQSVEELPSTLRELPPYELDNRDFDTIPSEAFNQNPWNFEDSKLLTIRAKLLDKFGNFGAFATVRDCVKTSLKQS